MEEVLMRAIVDLAAFLELSATDVVDSDAAVTQLEILGARLQTLDAHDRRRFIDFCTHEADRSSQPRYQSFLRALPENLGL